MSNPGLLLAEDAAVKRLLTGITVSDDRNGQRPVKVFFRHPEGETEKQYPFITVEHIGTSHATDIQHSEHYYHYYPDRPNSLDYWPSTATAAELTAGGIDGEHPDAFGNNITTVESFIPIYLMYQISTHARSAIHDRQLTSWMMRVVTPFRYGSIYVPEDDTVRRFDVLNIVHSDILDQESGYRKREFRKIFTIRMTAEVPSGYWTGVPAETIVSTVETVDNLTPPRYFTTITEAI